MISQSSIQSHKTYILRPSSSSEASPKVDRFGVDAPASIGSRVGEIAQNTLLSSGEDSQVSELKSQITELSSHPIIESSEAEGIRRAELERIYEEQVKDRPEVPGKLSAETPAKEEWVEMRLGLERKLSGGLLARLKQSAKTIGKGLSSIEKRGFKGAMLVDSCRMEPILPQHPMGPRIAMLSQAWQDAEGMMNFRDWLQANHPEKLVTERIAYLTEEERDLTALGFSEDGILMKYGAAYSTAVEKVANGLDQATNQAIYREGIAMYVVGPDETFHATSQVLFDKHHSSLFSGGAVIGAGECKVVDGRLTMISNKSGHYKPSKESMLDVLHILHLHHVLLTDVKLEVIMADNSRYIFKSAQEFLESRGTCLPKQIIKAKSRTRFKVRASEGGTRKLTVSSNTNELAYNSKHLRMSADYGWNLSEVQFVCPKGQSGDKLIYENAERFLNLRGHCLPTEATYGLKQIVRIISEEGSDVQVKKLIFSPMTTLEQVREMITFFKGENIIIDNPDIQIGEGETVPLFHIMPELSPEAEEARNQAMIEGFDQYFETEDIIDFGLGIESSSSGNQLSDFPGDFIEDVDQDIQEHIDTSSQSGGSEAGVDISYLEQFDDSNP